MNPGRRDRGAVGRLGDHSGGKADEPDALVAQVAADVRLGLALQGDDAADVELAEIGDLAG